MNNSVVLTRCEEYDNVFVNEAVSEMFAQLGGIEQFVKPGEKVFLKLNLLMKKKPEEAVTTHPKVVEAIINAIQNAGGKVTIGDSPGGPYTVNSLKAIYAATGMNEIAERTGCELNFDLSHKQVPVNGHVTKSLDIISPVMEFDKVIAVGKLKTHMFMTATMAVKLCFGYIPGLKKADYHVRMPKQDDFANLLIDIYEARRPDISIIDGIIGMEGDGPSAGSPIQVGCLIASTDAHLLDIVGAEIMGIPPLSIPTIKQAFERKLSPGTLRCVQIIGNNIDEFTRKFKNPNIRRIDSYTSKLPKSVTKFILNRIQPRPMFDPSRCKGCRDCERACPAKTISMVNNKAVVNLDNCIRCYCCHELCPHKAIDVRQSIISRFLDK